MLLTRLPRLRDHSVDPRRAFAGTFHIAEGYEQLATAYREAAAGRLPGAPPSEIYCHSLTDPSILGPDLAARGYQTLTLFGLHTPARLFAGGQRRRRAKPCSGPPWPNWTPISRSPSPTAWPSTPTAGRASRRRHPLDLERDLRLPGGHIFHRDLSFPYATVETGRWGVETAHANVLLCGAGAVRGGGVSGVPGHNAAMAALGR